MAAKKNVTPPPTLGSLVDSLFELRAKKGGLQAQLSVLDEEETQLEQAVLDALQAQGLDSARGTKASVSVSKTVVPQVADWAEFEKFVLRRKATHLLQRRLAVNACREMVTSVLGGKPIPGTVEFERTTLNVRKV